MSENKNNQARITITGEHLKGVVIGFAAGITVAIAFFAGFNIGNGR